MAFFGVRCPECRLQGNMITRKPRSGVRYAQCFDESGVAIGEFRYYHLHCCACEALFYLQERRLYEAPNALSQKQVVSQAVFQQASLHRPGTVHIGNTASEYTLRIAAGADTPYALKSFRKPL